MQACYLKIFFLCIALLYGCPRQATETGPPKILTSEHRQQAAETEPPKTLTSEHRQQEAKTEPLKIRTFGHRQLEQMLEDRPDMKDAVPSTHQAVAWLIDSFNGKRIGQRIYWNSNSPQSGRPAESRIAFHAYPPYISISAGAETTAIDKWAGAVYEMHNLENSDKFMAVIAEAANGSLDATSFSDKCVELEFATLKKTQNFFRHNPLPLSEHGRDVWYKWVMSDFGTFAEYKTAFYAPGANTFNSNFEYFKEYYKSAIAPHRKSIESKLNQLNSNQRKKLSRKDYVETKFVYIPITLLNKEQTIPDGMEARIEQSEPTTVTLRGPISLLARLRRKDIKIIGTMPINLYASFINNKKAISQNVAIEFNLHIDSLKEEELKYIIYELEHTRAIVYMSKKR